MNITSIIINILKKLKKKKHFIDVKGGEEIKMYVR